jgi:tRNA G46 methylase TrmB
MICSKEPRTKRDSLVAHAGEGRNVYRVLVGKPERKRPLERPRRRWEDGIKMEVMEIGWGGGVEWIHLAQDRDHWQALMNVVMNLWVLVPWS